MDVKKHRESFELIYRERRFGSSFIKFPLAESDKIQWDRGKYGNEYFSYFYRRFTCHILSRLKIEDDQNILVVGCGAGADEKNIKTLYPNIKLYSIDISKEMIKKSVANLSPSNFLVGLAEALPFKDNSFSRILSREVIEHVMDHQKMIFEISRVLKPEGIAVITTENEESFSPKNYYEINIKAKLASVLGISLPFRNFREKAPKLSEIKSYSMNTGLDLVEYFWDGALYKSLLRIWRKSIKRLITFPVSRWAHWFSCLENNRTLAYRFCDQAKYVLKKSEHRGNIASIYPDKTYTCSNCHANLQVSIDKRINCPSCDRMYKIEDNSLYLLSSGNNRQLNQIKKELNIGLAKQISFKVLNNVLSTSYNFIYFSFAMIFTIFAKKNDKQLSHLMAANDRFQKYLRIS